MGKRYIDSEAFFKVINTLPYKDTSYPDASAYNGAISDVADMLTHFPAADVVEVKHGRWEYTKELYRDPNGNHLFYGKICSECHNVSPYDSPYCMNCGANMQQGVTLAGAKMVNEDE